MTERDITSVAVSKEHLDKLEQIRRHRGERTYKDTVEDLIDEELSRSKIA